ncbi:hypothetical protein PENTCL1PPCAC_20239, partial [Pristionchus entomophagus]
GPRRNACCCRNLMHLYDGESSSKSKKKSARNSRSNDSDLKACGLTINEAKIIVAAHKKFKECLKAKVARVFYKHGWLLAFFGNLL